MTHRLRLTWWFLLIAALTGPVLAQPAPAPVPAPSSAPWLGDEKFTVHLAGPLRTVLDQLGKLTGRRYDLPGSRNAAGEWVEQMGDVPVKLDFGNATLDQILLSLCRQAGLVYTGWDPGRGGRLSLLKGDPQLDPRPVVLAGDYLVRIADILVQPTVPPTRIEVFNWGQPVKPYTWGKLVPDKPRTATTVMLDAEVTALTLDAARKLAGISVHGRAVPDQGAPLEADGADHSGYEFHPGYDFPDTWTMHARVIFPGLAREATKLTRLEGALALFSTVKVTQIRIVPNAVGQTFQQDDLAMTEKYWAVEHGALEVALEGPCPALPRSSPHNWQTALLVAKDGRELYPQETPMDGGAGVNYLPEGEIWVSWRFVLPQTAAQAPGTGGTVPTEKPFVVDYLRVTFVRTGDADAALPFVINDIPLP